MTRRIYAAIVGLLLTGACTGSRPLASAEGQSFYLFRSGTRCAGPMPGGAPVPSWLDRIEIHDGRPIRWGTRCGGEGLPLPPAEAAQARLSRHGHRLIIGGTVYRRARHPEQIAEQQP